MARAVMHEQHMPSSLASTVHPAQQNATYAVGQTLVFSRLLTLPGW